MANIVVLGAGLVGGVMAKDLSKHHKVTSIDISKKNLDKLEGINTICADISLFILIYNITVLMNCDSTLSSVTTSRFLLLARNFWNKFKELNIRICFFNT